MGRSRRPIVHGEKIAPASFGSTAIRAQGLELKNLIGCPFSGVTFKVDQGQVCAIRGRNGSGKTALLLTCAGRMAPTKGTLRILGYTMPKQASKVRKRIGLGLFEDLNELAPTQRVRNAVAAELELWGRRARKADAQAYMEEWHLTEMADMRISELTREQLLALGVQLAWVGHPDIIVVDDIESGLTKGQSVQLMQRIKNMAQSRNVTILVGVLERDLAAMADCALYLGEKSGARFQINSRQSTQNSAHDAAQDPAHDAAHAAVQDPAHDAVQDTAQDSAHDIKEASHGV